MFDIIRGYRNVRNPPNALIERFPSILRVRSGARSEAECTFGKLERREPKKYQKRTPLRSVQSDEHAVGNMPVILRVRRGGRSVAEGSSGIRSRLYQTRTPPFRMGPISNQ